MKKIALIFSLMAMLLIIAQDIKNTPIDNSKQLVIVKMLANK